MIDHLGKAKPLQGFILSIVKLLLTLKINLKSNSQFICVTKVLPDQKDLFILPMLLSSVCPLGFI